MDGVLIRSEQEWMREEQDEGMLEHIFGEEITKKLGWTVGISIGDIYKKGVALGSSVTKEEFMAEYAKAAQKVYRRCQITKGVDKVVSYLKSNGWQLALASASPLDWINLVLNRLTWKDQLDLVLSVNEHPKIKPKPAPDGYQYILKTLGSAVADSIALEDSNPGILSAKTAGLFTIGYTEHLVEGYKQIEADAKAGSMDEVIRILDAEKH